MSEKEIARKETNDFTKKNVFISFDGWLHSASELIEELENNGYEVPIDCCTYRHHAIIRATKCDA